MKIVKLYFATGILLIIISILKKDSLDIAVHDTYYVIPFTIIFLMLAFLFFIFGGIQLLFEKRKKPLNTVISYIHYFTSILCLITFYFLNNQEPKRTYEDYSVYNEFNESPSSFDVNSLLAIVFLIGLLAQLLFVINTLISAFKQKQLK